MPYTIRLIDPRTGHTQRHTEARLDDAMVHVAGINDMHVIITEDESGHTAFESMPLRYVHPWDIHDAIADAVGE